MAADLVSQMSSLLRRAEAMTKDEAVKKMKGQMKAWINELLDEAEGFHDVTGNTRNGFFAGMYVDGKFIYGERVRSIKKPTRDTLIKGEAYDLDEYWGGDEVTGKPFVGIYGERNYDARDEAKSFMESFTPTEKNGITFVFGNSVNYAKFIEVHKRGNLVTEFRNLMASAGWNVSKVYGK